MQISSFAYIFRLNRFGCWYLPEINRALQFTIVSLMLAGKQDNSVGAKEWGFHICSLEGETKVPRSAQGLSVHPSLGSKSAEWFNHWMSWAPSLLVWHWGWDMGAIFVIYFLQFYCKIYFGHAEPPVMVKTIEAFPPKKPIFCQDLPSFFRVVFN